MASKKKASSNGDGTSVLEMAFPVKGLNTAAGFHNQPPDTSHDLMNVMPYDIYGGQLRGSQRPGTDNINSPSIDLLKGVRAMIQHTRTLDPDNIVADQTLLDEDFSVYADSTDVSTIDSGNRWSYSDSSTPNRIIVTSGQASCVTVGLSTGMDVFASAGPVGAAYIIKMTANFNSQPNGTARIAICVKYNGPDAPRWNAQYVVDFADDSVDIRNSAGTSVATASVSLSDVDSHTFEVDVSGTKIDALVNGVLKATYTSSSPLVYDGFGFGSRRSTGGTAHIERFQLYTGKSPLSFRQTDILCLAGDALYIGNYDTLGSFTAIGSGLDFTAPASMVASGDTLYTVDGSHTKATDLTTQTTADMTASTGTLPTKSRIAALWRNRLILAASDDDPQNWHASRVGVHDDFDYSQTDPAAAFAGNDSKAGQVGEPITAIMPFTDDLMLIGCDHSLWLVSGDPADGGSIGLVTAGIGVAGQEAWCQDPAGMVYFVGTGGLYRMAPGGVPSVIDTSVIPQFLRNLNPGANYVILRWDTTYHGLWIFITPAQSGITTTHMFWDSRTNGFFPMRFPDNHGPLSAMVYDGDDPDDRVLLIGGRDGYVRKFTTGSTNDDGTAISSYVWLGPFRPADGINQARLIAGDWYLGNVPATPSVAWNLGYLVQVGDDGDSAIYDPADSFSGSFTTVKRQTRVRTRLRGGMFAVKISNSTLDKWWSFERVNLTLESGGRINT